jgi:hypothetical protein
MIRRQKKLQWSGARKYLKAALLEQNAKNG